MPLGVAAATATALLALVLLLASLRGRARPPELAAEPRFVAALSAGGTGLAAIAIVWQGTFSILTVPACV